jgi:hypothetical protein
VQVDTLEWHRYEMTATEFLYRILTDPGFYRPYSVTQAVSASVAQHMPEPFFEPA